MSGVYVADFETTVREEFACVWLYSIVNVYDYEEYHYGYSIDDFFKSIIKISPKTCFFHNLKFDGMYVIDYLLRHGYKYTDRKTPAINEFKCLVGEQGQFYSISFTGETGTISLWDSLKIFNFSVDEIAQTFKLETQKGEIDYNKERPIGYIPDEVELSYVKNDVMIVAQAIRMFLSKGYTKMTIASNALEQFKLTLDKKQFNYMFPKLPKDIDHFCRKAYRGGYTYVNPIHQNKIVGMGSVFDVNSMYPWALYYKPMPIGQGSYFIGKPPEDKLYFIRVHIGHFKVKQGYLPTLQMKHNYRYDGTEYLTEGSDIETYFTSVDYKLFRDFYDIDGLTECDGYSFESRDTLFRSYIDKYMEIKKTTTGGERSIAKLFLNGLYGKFGSKIEKISKIPYLDEETNTIKFHRTDPKETDPIYIPVAAFVTAYAHDNIIRNAQACGDRFLYCDTDSLHVLGRENPDIPIHKSELGYYKRESVFKNAIFIKPKTYSEITRETKKYKMNYKGKEMNVKAVFYQNEVKCCGLPKNLIKQGKVTFENFRMGAEYYGKLLPKVIPGGVVLEETTFTIK